MGARLRRMIFSGVVLGALPVLAQGPAWGSGVAGTLSGNPIFGTVGDGAGTMNGEVLLLLRSADPARRRMGIDQLEGLPGREPARLILERLSDSDGGVRARSALALSRLRLMEAAGPLVDHLGDADSTVRAAAAAALGHFGALPPGLSGRAASSLARALGDAGHEVRLSALRALGDLLLNQAIPAKELPLLIGPVLLRVDDENVGVRRAAVVALGRMGPLGGFGLRDPSPRPFGLRDPSPRPFGLRDPSPRPFGLRDPAERAVVPLLGRLSDSARDVRAEALVSLAALQATAATPAALRLLRDPAEEVRRQAILCLGSFRAAAAVPELAQILESGPEPLRAAAAVALGQVARPGPEPEPRPGPKIDPADRQGEAVADGARAAAVAALLRGLSREELRPAAREALLSVGVAVVPALAEQIEKGPGGQEEIGALVGLLAELGAQAPAPLRSRVGATLVGELSRGRLPKEQVVDALGGVGDRASAAAVAGLLLDGDAVVRRHAIEALRRPGLLDERALHALLSATADEDPEVRGLSIEALGDLHAPVAVPRLLEVLARGDARTRTAAARALGGFGNPAPGPALDGKIAQGLTDLVVTARTGDGEPRARKAGAEALGRLLARAPGLTRIVVPALTAALHRPGNARGEGAAKEVLIALGAVLRGHPDELGREALLGLAQSSAEAHTPEAALALSALAALSAMRDPASATRLQRLLSHGDPLRRLRAAFALGCLLVEAPADGPVQGLLSTLASDADPRVRAEAAWALSRLRPGARQQARVVTGLRQALLRGKTDGDAGERANLAAALAILGQADPGDADLLLDGDVAVRANGALLLGLIAPSSDGLRARLRALANTDEDHRVRRSAALALSGKAEVGPATALRRRHWLLLSYVDYDGRPLAEARYRLSTPEGLIRVGVTDARGGGPEELLLPGRCETEVVDEGGRGK